MPTQSAEEQNQIPRTNATDGEFKGTDQQMVDRVCQALHARGYVQLRQLQVYFEYGRITLQGRLPTYYLKQVAQSVILSVEGVRDIDNDVKVVS